MHVQNARQLPLNPRTAQRAQRSTRAPGGFAHAQNCQSFPLEELLERPGDASYSRREADAKAGGRAGRLGGAGWDREEGGLRGAALTRRMRSEAVHTCKSSTACCPSGTSPRGAEECRTAPLLLLLCGASPPTPSCSRCAASRLACAWAEGLTHNLCRTECARTAGPESAPAAPVAIAQSREAGGPGPAGSPPGHQGPGPRLGARAFALFSSPTMY